MTLKKCPKGEGLKEDEGIGDGELYGVVMWLMGSEMELQAAASLMEQGKMKLQQTEKEKGVPDCSATVYFQTRTRQLQLRLLLLTLL